MDPALTLFKHIAASGEPTISALESTSLDHGYMPYGVSKYLKVDAIFMPDYQGTAQSHDLFGFVPYTVLWNVRDVRLPLPVSYSYTNSPKYPSCIIPHGKANKSADKAFIRNVNYKPPLLILKFQMKGAPYCVQLVGRNMHDEELVKVAELVSEILKP
ncbi:Amidase [Penicillium fimorum]|uniref:Amidase n=1 Tax=Penicillium fimorum TaxID=1882269 RepID=A0A9W9XXH4_9EURO|nr:Amidase [Penicillium fimorum]